jgi:hypothetical protein
MFLYYDVLQLQLAPRQMTRKTVEKAGNQVEDACEDVKKDINAEDIDC